jgi:hypothetical protein
MVGHAASHGSQMFQLSNTNGFVYVSLDSVDLSSYKSVTVQGWIRARNVHRNWQITDKLKVWVADTDSTDVEVFAGGDLDAGQLDYDGWFMYSANIPQSFEVAVISFGLLANSETKEAWFDHFQLLSGSGATGPLGYCTTVCPPGSHMPAGSAVCKPCAAGHFQPFNGVAAVCQACPRGKYANQTASTACADCATGLVSPEGAAACLIEGCTDTLSVSYNPAASAMPSNCNVSNLLLEWDGGIVETASFPELGPAGIHAPKFAGIKLAVAQPLEACSVLANTTGADMTGKMALVRDGLCPVATKIANAQASGAAGVIVYSGAAAATAIPSSCGNPAVPSQWNIGYGNCSTYAAGSPNHAYCEEDGATAACPVSCKQECIPWPAALEPPVCGDPPVDTSTCSFDNNGGY